MRTSLRYLIALLAPCAAWAQVMSPAPEAVEVTIYRASPGSTADVADMRESANGLAMISETRTLDLPAGLATISFRGVAETIVPQSAKLISLPGTINETNFDYSLIGPGELIAKSIGKSVRVVRMNRDTGNVQEQRATLLSGPEGVLLNVDGRIEALSCSGADEALIFDEIPAELTADPTLSATVNTKEAGRYRVQLSYLAVGLDWSADYVARIHPNERKLDLTGWITLANKQATPFAGARVNVVAGNVSVLTEETVPQRIAPLFANDKCWPVGSFISTVKEQQQFYDKMEGMPLASPMAMRSLNEVVVTGSFNKAVQTDLGDYKLYTVPNTTTVAAKQIKQVQMIDQRDVPFERIYTYKVEPGEFDGETIANRPMSTLRLQNKKSSGLGVALPAGTVSVMEPHTGGLALSGEQTLRDLPIGLPVDIELGEAMDIAVQPRLVRENTQSTRTGAKRVAEIEIDIANNKPIAIQLEIFQRKEQEQGFRIVTESKRHTIKQGMPMWSLSMKSGERARLRYTVEQAD